MKLVVEKIENGWNVPEKCSPQTSDVQCSVDMYKMKHDGDVETCTESDSYNLIYDLVDVSFGFWSLF